MIIELDGTQELETIIDSKAAAQLNSVKSTPTLSTYCDFLRQCPLVYCPLLQFQRTPLKVVGKI